MAGKCGVVCDEDKVCSLLAAVAEPDAGAAAAAAGGSGSRGQAGPPAGPSGAGGACAASAAGASAAGTSGAGAAAGGAAAVAAAAAPAAVAGPSGAEAAEAPMGPLAKYKQVGAGRGRQQRKGCTSVTRRVFRALKGRQAAILPEGCQRRARLGVWGAALRGLRIWC